MSVKVAINGFGRIGRLAFRQMFGAEGYEVVAINDLTKPEMLAHLLKYDTAQGGYCGRIGENLHTVDVKPAVYAEDGKTVVTPGAIIVDGKEITIYAKPNAADLPWGELGVDVVLECTGFYVSKAKSQAHIDAGAKKVVISAPAGNDLPTIVYNVNHKTLTKDDTIISAASCTTNCLAPMAKALNDYAPIASGIMSTIHAYTGDQMILDGPHRKGDLRRARAGAANIVPNSTGAAKAIGLVIPQTNGICERFNRTVQNEFYAIAFRKKIYTSIEQLQADLDTWMNSYNTQRTHSGKYCFGKTPMQTFLEGMEVARRYQLQDAGKIQPDEQVIGSSGCESENSCVSSQMASDTFFVR